MATVTNAYQTYNAQANREDLSDVIYNIDPFDTPFMSMAGRRNVTNRTFDWQTESLPAVNASNADEEGFTLVNTAGTATVRESNVTQISHRDATVAGTQEQVKAAGRPSEMAAQVALKSKALKRDIESILCSTQARVNGSSGVARQTRALEHWISTNTDYGATGANPVSETAALTDGNLRTLDEDRFNDMLEEMYGNGAEAKVALVGPSAKRKISSFVGRTGSEVKVGQKEVVNAVDLYKSDFGDIKIMPTRWLRGGTASSRTIFLLDPQYIAVAYFRPFKTVDIATTGDAMTKMIVTEYGLEMRNEKAHGKISDLQY
jgi:hypothetical protein